MRMSRRIILVPISIHCFGILSNCRWTWCEERLFRWSWWVGQSVFPSGPCKSSGGSSFVGSFEDRITFPGVKWLSWSIPSLRIQVSWFCSPGSQRVPCWTKPSILSWISWRSFATGEVLHRALSSSPVRLFAGSAVCASGDFSAACCSCRGSSQAAQRSSWSQ